MYRKFGLWLQRPVDNFWALFSKSEFVRHWNSLSVLWQARSWSSKIWYCVIGCYFRVLDADWMDDVCQRCSDSCQILQADVAERGSVWRESVVCGKMAIYLIDFRNIWCWLIMQQATTNRVWGADAYCWWGCDVVFVVGASRVHDNLPFLYDHWLHHHLCAYLWL